MLAIAHYAMLACNILFGLTLLVFNEMERREAKRTASPKASKVDDSSTQTKTKEARD